MIKNLKVLVDGNGKVSGIGSDKQSYHHCDICKVPEITKYSDEEIAKMLTIMSVAPEMFECLKRCRDDILKINETMIAFNLHPFTLMEKDIHETLEKVLDAAENQITEKKIEKMVVGGCL